MTIRGKYKADRSMRSEVFKFLRCLHLIKERRQGQSYFPRFRQSEHESKSHGLHPLPVSGLAGPGRCCARICISLVETQLSPINDRYCRGDGPFHPRLYSSLCLRSVLVCGRLSPPEMRSAPSTTCPSERSATYYSSFSYWTD